MIQAHHLTKQFPARPSSPAVTALSSLNLTIKKGTLTALIGPDGAGKTTFMRLVCGLLQSDSGSLSVCGYDVQQSPQAVQDRIGYMPQKFGLYEDLSVMENLTLYADIHSVPPDLRQKHFRELLDLTGLSPLYGPSGREIIGRHETETGAGMYPRIYAGSVAPR
jgi:ABC-2 type transport system ATP-binding protein